MEKLIRGIHKFQSDVFPTREKLFRNLVGGQTPQALFITCSDSRIVPDLICQADPGDLFVIRNAGNIVPPYSEGVTGGEAATIEYAVRALGVKDIIVCGHTRCGAMQGTMNPDTLTPMPSVKQWLAHAEASWDIVRAHYNHLPDELRWKVLIQENVLVQLENLRTHPVVADALERGALQLHAWVYKMETGQVFGYSPESGQYTPIVSEADADPARPRAAIMTAI
jgi:carbonic anhydrase